MTMRTAIIAGQGALPAELIAALNHAGAPFDVAAMDGFAPDLGPANGIGIGTRPVTTFRIERLVPFMEELRAGGVARVVFAGAVRRPRIDPTQIDPATLKVVPRLMAAAQGGDDALLRAVIGLFEDAGLPVVGAEAIAPDLVPGAGVLAGTPDAAHVRDAARAAAIVAALGSVDVGQGAVVAHGLCLGVETLGGTDAMLAAVAALPAGLRGPGAAGRGLLYKAPKPGQDRRIDLPAIGPATLEAVSRAGLAGIAWEAGGVMVLDRSVVLEGAERRGLFLWSRAPT